MNVQVGQIYLTLIKWTLDLQSLQSRLVLALGKVALLEMHYLIWKVGFLPHPNQSETDLTPNPIPKPVAYFPGEVLDLLERRSGKIRLSSGACVVYQSICFKQWSVGL